MSRNAEDCENSGSLPQLESEPEVEQIGEVSEEVPFEIPNKWKWTTLGEMGKWQAGGTPARSNLNFFRRGNIPWLKTGDLNDSEIKEVAEYITEEAIKNSSAHVNPIGSVLMAMYGATIGKLGILTFPCATNQACCACVVNENFVDKWYLFFYLLSQRTKFIALGAGGAQPNISRKKIVGYLIPLPPLAEQRRIVARLNELLPLVDDFGEAQEAFEVTQTEFPGKLKDSLLQVTIEGKLVPQLESEPEVEQISETPEDVPFTIPLKWKWATIGDSLQYGSSEQVNGQSIPRNAWVLDLEDIEKESGRLLIKKRNISNRSNKAKFKKGDVLYGKLRPYLNKCIIADEAGFSTTEIVAIRPKEGNYKFDAEYLKAFLMSPFFVNYANQASYGVKMPRLGTKDAKAAFIPVPPLAEQCRIVARLNKLLASINQLGD